MSFRTERYKAVLKLLAVLISLDARKSYLTLDQIESFIDKWRHK